MMTARRRSPGGIGDSNSPRLRSGNSYINSFFYSYKKWIDQAATQPGASTVHHRNIVLQSMNSIGKGISNSQIHTHVAGPDASNYHIEVNEF